MSKGYLFSSESVTEGHPDKLADQISDAVLDAMLAKDPNSRVACETLVTTGVVFVSGEITHRGLRRHPVGRARTRWWRSATPMPKFGLDGYTCGVITAIQEQSPDIAIGVDHALEEREEHSQDDARHAGRRRPGDDVRLRLPRDRRADAVADRDGAPSRQAPVRRPQGGRRSVSASRRQESGLGRVRRRQAGAGRHRADQRAAP